jgi:dual 3',5'-cyclic-AMP and -GMP phosphodiesterase 11
MKYLQGPGGLDWNDSSDRSLALNGLMTGCDLGAITKDFDVQRRVAYTVAEEFWAQGDIMKELAFPVGDLQDRALSYKLPEKQVGFCVFVCLPVYKALRDLNKAFKPLWEAVERNKARYLKWNGTASVYFIPTLRWGEEAAKIEEVKEDEEEESRTV